LCLSRDEEIGCTGAPPMIVAMQAHMPRASMAIIGEPTEWGIVNGHKGGVGFDLHFRGFEVHSSLAYTGVSAIMEGARLIDWANDVNAENAAKADPANPYDPPYTSLHVGMIQGGTAHNITAKDCRFVLTARTVPGEGNAHWSDRILAEIARIEAGMKAVRPDTGITVIPKWDVPGLKAEVEGEAEALVRRLTGENGFGVVSYGTEAGQFQAAGYSAVVCGPGNIAQAHQPNEYMTVAQFERGQAFMARLLDHLQEG
jgi:acetylornithine deacetylase